MAEFEGLGTRYPLAFTIRVVEKVCERYGSLKDFDNLATDRTDIELLKEYIWVLREMMLGAAAKISMEKGSGIADIPDLERLYDVLEWGSYPRILKAVNSCLVSDSDRTVEAEEDPKAAKNAKAAQI